MFFNKNTRVKIVPWTNAAQFKKVYEYLFSDDVTKKKWAIDTIAIWETRCHTSLPTAIEATYVLTSAVIQDFLWTNKANLINHTDLQGMYGSAVTRFVSLSVEVNKNTEYPGYSIAEVAKSIGIPSFIVDIRNEWCHSSRPTVAVLRLAAQSALKYLKESYWEQEVARVTNYVKQPPDETELVMLFKDYIKFHDDVSTSTKVKIVKTAEGNKLLTPEYKKLVGQLEKYLKMNRRFFVKVLVSDGVFIPSDEDLKSMLPEKEYSLFVAEYFMDDDNEEEEEMEDDMSDLPRNEKNIQTDYLEDKNSPKIPEYHEDLWHSVIQMLHKYDSMPLFIEYLLKSQGDRTVLGQKLIVIWMLTILKIHSGCLDRVKSPMLKDLFRHKAIVPNYMTMLYSAVANPCKYTLHLLPYILGNLELSMEVSHRIVGLASLKLGLAPREKSKKGSQRKSYYKLFHTPNDLREALEFQEKEEGKNIKMMPKSKAKQKMKELATENIWSPCPDDCFKLWRIGDIVNAVKDILEEEKAKHIFPLSSIDSEMSDQRMMICNENEDEDDDDVQTWKMGEEPDLCEMMLEIEGKETVRY